MYIASLVVRSHHLRNKSFKLEISLFYFFLLAYNSLLRHPTATLKAPILVELLLSWS